MGLPFPLSGSTGIECFHDGCCCVICDAPPRGPFRDPLGFRELLMAFTFEHSVLSSSGGSSCSTALVGKEAPSPLEVTPSVGPSKSAASRFSLSFPGDNQHLNGEILRSDLVTLGSSSYISNSRLSSLALSMCLERTLTFLRGWTPMLQLTFSPLVLMVLPERSFTMVELCEVDALRVLMPIL